MRSSEKHIENMRIVVEVQSATAATSDTGWGKFQTPIPGIQSAYRTVF